MFKACALVLRDMMALHGAETMDRVERAHERRVHYLSLEFLMGRSLMKNAYNLGVLEAMNGAIENMGFKSADILKWNRTRVSETAAWAAWPPAISTP